MFDGLSISLDGLKRFAQSGSESIHNIRLPRHLINDVPILPYSEYQAQGYEILRDLQNDNIAIQEIYWAHLYINVKKISILYFITNSRIYLLRKTCTQILSKYQLIDKSIPLDKIETTNILEANRDTTASIKNKKKTAPVEPNSDQSSQYELYVSFKLKF